MQLCFAEAMPSRSRNLRSMVRWSDGLYGGLIAGLVSALFFLLVGTVIDHQTVFGDYFVEFAAGIFGPKILGLPLLALGFGLFLHFIAAAFFGICYALVAARFKPMWTAPTSVLCGFTYGLLMYFVAEDVAVPILRVTSYTPTWEALLGFVLFFGLVMSEYITIAHRRNLAALA